MSWGLGPGAEGHHGAYRPTTYIVHQLSSCTFLLLSPLSEPLCQSSVCGFRLVDCSRHTSPSPRGVRPALRPAVKVGARFLSVFLSGGFPLAMPSPPSSPTRSARNGSCVTRPRELWPSLTWWREPVPSSSSHLPCFRHVPALHPGKLCRGRASPFPPVKDSSYLGVKQVLARASLWVAGRRGLSCHPVRVREPSPSSLVTLLILGGKPKPAGEQVAVQHAGAGAGAEGWLVRTLVLRWPGPGLGRSLVAQCYLPFELAGARKRHLILISDGSPFPPLYSPKTVGSYRTVSFATSQPSVFWSS